MTDLFHARPFFGPFRNRVIEAGGCYASGMRSRPYLAVTRRVFDSALRSPYPRPFPVVGLGPACAGRPDQVSELMHSFGRTITPLTGGAGGRAVLDPAATTAGMVAVCPQMAATMLAPRPA